MINVMLVGWPLLTIVLARVLPWPNAVIASLIGGYLLLPERGGINLPLLPAFEKDTIPALTLLLLALVMRPGQQGGPRVAATQPAFDARDGWLPKSITGVVLLAMLVTGAFLTALSNGDSIRFPDSSFSIPGLGLYDGFSMIVTSVSLFVPILLGRKYLAHPDAHRLLLMGLALSGLAYSLLALIEIRLSPQLSNWVYGFFPHGWEQHVRDGGFRPVVFLQHALWLAIFLSMAAIAAAGLSRVMPGARLRWLLAAAWLVMTIVLGKSLGSLAIALFLIPAALLLTARLQLLVAGCIAAAILTYPLLRGADLVPTRQILSVVENIDPNRALSLQFRFFHEDQLIERANDRALFGWGGWGRNRVYDEAGRDQSVVDGAWIVTIGQGGWLRYIGEFGLLALPVLLLALRRRSHGIDPATAALCLVLAANMIDLIPNGTRTPVTWLLVGALLGRLELGAQAKPAAAASSPPDGAQDTPFAQQPVSPYTRQSVPHQRLRLSRNA